MKRIKVNENRDARVIVINMLKKKLKEVKFVNKVAVDICGKIFYMDEHEVRALQVLAKEAYNTSEVCWKEFCDNVIVYSGRTITSSDHIMHFRKDGKFVEDFDKGFYSAIGELLFKLL